MKNLVKKTMVTAAAGILLLFAGCSNLLGGGESSQNKEKTYTVSGSINFGNALPSTLAETLKNTEASARTATSSFSSSAEGAVFTVTAKQGEIIADGTIEKTSTGYKYNLKLPLSGEWTLYAKMMLGSTVILEGEAGLYTDSGMSQTQDIVVSPVNTEGSGSVNLTIIDGTENSLIKRVSSKAVQNMLVIDEPVEPNVDTGIKEFTDKKATIVMNDVSAGTYEVTFNFEDAAGNILYSCKEIFTVFVGFATDTWYGTSPHMTRNTDGTYSFVITDNLISGYGTETVPDTQMVLYTLAAGGDNYDYHLVSDAGTTVSDSTKTASNAASSYNSFCFDSNGYFYAITNISESATYIKSDKTDFGSNTASSNDGAMYLYGDCGRMITCDTKTDIIYLFDSSNAAITQVTKDDGSYTYNATNSCYDPAKVYSVSSEDSNRSIVQAATAFAVYDGIVYCAALDSDGGKLAIINLNDADADNQVTVSKTVGLGLSLGPSDAKITDMLYQDGAVYILYREVSVSSVGIYSRGAVIRYDTVFGSTKIMGYADTEKKFSEPIGTDSDTGESIYAKLPAYYNGTSQLFTDSSLKNPLYVPFNTSWTYGSNYTLYDVLPFYTPTLNEENLSDEAFYGPVKFIAVKPKKLVIADDGLAFYTDADGVTKYRNVNRVVTVDLESFSIIESETANVTLSGDDSDLKTVLAASTSTSYQTALSTFFTTSKYYKNDESIVETNETYYAQLGIPCGD